MLNQVRSVLLVASKTLNIAFNVDSNIAWHLRLPNQAGLCTALLSIG